jgi:hypothetical protein
MIMFHYLCTDPLNMKGRTGGRETGRRGWEKGEKGWEKGEKGENEETKKT